MPRPSSTTRSRRSTLKQRGSAKQPSSEPRPLGSNGQGEPVLKLTRRARPQIPKRAIERVKIIVVGDSGVGKSSLVQTFCGEIFQPHLEPTVAVDFLSHDMYLHNTRLVKANFWDMSGHSHFEEVRCELYRPNKGEPQGFILMFDVTKRSTFDHLGAWLAEAKKFGGNPVDVVVCGGKSEVSADLREVSLPEGEAWASARGFTYIETSSKCDKNTQETVSALVARLFRGTTDTNNTGQYPNENDSKQQQNQQRRQQHQQQKKQPQQEYKTQKTQSRHHPKTTMADTAQTTTGAYATSTTIDLAKLTPPYLDQMPIKEMKSLLTTWGVSTANCITKQDLRTKLEGVIAEVKKRREEGKLLQQKKQNELIHDKVMTEIADWVRGKDIRAMLNSVHGNGVNAPIPSPLSPTCDALGRMSSLTAVAKAYKKALLRIHPDKTDQNDYEAHLRATETFKAVNAAYLRFRSRNEKRQSLK